MNLSDRRLKIEIAIVIVIKLVLIYALWWAFFRNATVTVDPATMAAQVVSPLPAPPLTAGENDAR